MADSEGKDSGLDLDRVRDVFEGSQDFTVGLEEEFAIVNPESLELEHRFEDLFAACKEDEVLADSAAGELIDTEIEIRFLPDGKDRTRVELEHRHLDRFGARRDEMRRVFDQEGDWGKLLAMFARVAEGATS